MKKTLSLLALLMVMFTTAWADTVVLGTPSESVATFSDANGIVTITDGSSNTGIQPGGDSFQITYADKAYTPMKLSGSRNFTLSYKEGVTISKVTLLAMSNGDGTGTVGAGNGDATSLGNFPVRNTDNNCLTVDITGKDGLRGSRQFLALIVVEYSTTEPALSASPNELTFALSPSKATESRTFTLTGQNLADGSYSLTLPNLAGLSVEPTSFTVADGAVSQEFTVTYASTEDVAKASTEIAATVGELTAKVAVTYQSRATAYQQATVSADAAWDWSKLSETVQLTDETTPTKSEEFLLADLDDRINFTEDFGDPAAIKMASMQFPSRGGYAQGTYVKFKTSVPGVITVDFSNTGSGDRPNRYLNVNGVNTEFASNSTGKVNATGIEVPAGEVVLMGNMVDEEAESGFTPNMLRWYKITFEPTEPEAEVASLEGKLVIGKVFYAGSTRLNGATPKNYMKHLYIELYNNSAENIDVAGTHIALANSDGGTAAWTAADMAQQHPDSVVVKQIFQIPTTDAVTMEPGQSLVLANCAVDHSEIAEGAVNLSDADFEVKSTNNAFNDHNENVPELTVVKTFGTSDFINFLNPGPDGIVLLPASTDIDNCPTTYGKGKTTGNLYTIVPLKGSIDCVDIVKQKTPSADDKRISEVYDAGFTCTEDATTFNCQAVARKIASTEGDGRKVLTDTNNSSNDFETLSNVEPRVYGVGIVTAIGVALTDKRETPADSFIYNLQGVRRSQLQPGLNIVNKRKVVVK